MQQTTPVSFRAQPTDAHSRRLVPNDKSQAASEDWSRKTVGQAQSVLLAGQLTLVGISAQF